MLLVLHEASGFLYLGADERHRSPPLPESSFTPFNPVVRAYTCVGFNRCLAIIIFSTSDVPSPIVMSLTSR